MVRARSDQSYPDRNGAPIGRYTETVAEQYVPYVMPQEHGGHADTRWGVVHDAAGWGLLVTAADPFQWNVSMFTPEQLTAAVHAEELVPGGGVTMHLDAGTAASAPCRAAPTRCRSTASVPDATASRGRRHRCTSVATTSPRPPPSCAPGAAGTADGAAAPLDLRVREQERDDLGREGRVQRGDVHAVGLGPQLDGGVVAAVLRVRRHVAGGRFTSIWCGAGAGSSGVRAHPS